MKLLFIPATLLLAMQAAVPTSAAAAAHSKGAAQFGVASYYGEPQRLASGSRFDPHAMTAAHKTLPFGTHEFG
jgi:rare lipoprotein A